MSSDRKSITIDSSSLIGGGNGGGSSKRRSKRSSGSGERKIRPSSIVQPSTLKKTLLERIKQHQRTRERSRIQDDRDSQKESNDDAGHANKENTNASHSINKGDDNFSQSMDFLRKLALKRREQQQYTQKRRHTDTGIGLPEAKTPEAKMLNQVSETLKHGEILTNTGLLGLPVVPMLSTTPNVITASLPQPEIQLGSMTMTMPSMPSMPSMHANSASESQPVITDLADMYNNTIAAVDQAPKETTKEASAEPPLHIPQNPEDYLPSIFIKEDPPHGCLR